MPEQRFIEQERQEVEKAWAVLTEGAHALKEVILAAMEKASAAATAPAGHVIDDKGVVRRVLGTLPVTADGCVIGAAATVYVRQSNRRNAKIIEHLVCVPMVEGCDYECPHENLNLDLTYSTEQSARAAEKQT